MESDISQQILLLAFVVAAIMGGVVNKTNFCTMGAVSDWVNMGDTGRMRAWLFAMAVAILGVLVFESTGVADLRLAGSDAIPPYRTPSFAWLRYILGGVLFGIGMTLGSGCGNKTLVRIGGGNIKAVVVLAMIAIFAYLMTKTNFYGVVFHTWISATTIDLASRGFQSQELGAVAAGLLGLESSRTVYMALAALIGVALLVVAFKSQDFRSRFDNILGGAAVGLAVVAGWYVTAGPMGEAWKEAAIFMDNPPAGVAQQSYTFINPAGETLAYLMSPGNLGLITFGVMAVAGVIFGSFVYALVSRKFRIEWFASFSDFTTHVIGGILMGVGGVLSMGCTIGQGVTGVSTLALGSFLTFGAIVFGSALTMKVQYYRMVYEGEASFPAALLSALVDMRLLPKGMRKLEAV